jgi:NAD(P)H-dependent FMN reductase
VPKLQIIITSTRPGRVGLPVGQWFAERARGHGGFDVEVLDLAEINLPFLDEPHHPRLRKYTRQHTKDWSAAIDSGDAYVFVMPEYNFGMNAPMKNAIDYLNQEWQHKPVGFVSYGGVSGGTRAVQMAKQVVSTLKMVPMFEAVSIPFVAQFLDAERRIKANDVMSTSANAMLDELLRYAEALAPLRVQAAV